MFFIFESSIQLSLENPLNDPHGKKVQILDYIDIINTTIFSLESIMKIIATGLIFNGKKSYLRSYWNCIDFIIVIFSVTFFDLIFYVDFVP